MDIKRMAWDIDDRNKSQKVNPRPALSQFENINFIATLSFRSISSVRLFRFLLISLFLLRRLFQWVYLWWGLY